ncbi:hypothetical protein DSO57_1029043 [Entomophthora muscae]|uniref:Uncharacterized protein n=1 Tax=Entomophthora muscae TaxID=34485 RepID=A0ACC2SE12_9FUNG|nr:hypothetical protein DSO57_1029043 [Entomophthora muscae]
MRGYLVDKEFKSRKWNSESLKISTVGGKTLSLPCYTATPPLERRFSQDPPCREIPGLKHKYFVSTITKPIVRPGPMMPIPIPSVPIRAPITNHLLPVIHSKSSKERMNCPVPNCNKDFADRSSLNRHKKRMHPEFTTSRSNLSRP